VSVFDWTAVAAAVACVLAAAYGSAVEAAFSSVSKVRARELAQEGRRGAERLQQMVQDPAPYLNASHLLRHFLETSAVVLVALVFFGHFPATWERIALPIVAMALVSFVLLGVSPRTLGRQHADAIA
jgi:Mg2+/Co2+ transporter CorB